MPDPIATAIGSKIVDFGMGQLGNMISGSQALSNYRHIYENYTSPSAQVAALAKAGLNPAVAMGNQSPLLSGSDNIQLPQNPFGVGTSSLSDIANFMNAKAQAKKAGAEVKNLDIEAQAKQFDLELSKVFSAPEKFAALTLAWKNVRLADDEHSIKEWQREKEKALSETQGIQRDTLQKILNNMDIQLEQENTQRAEDIKLTKEKQKTEGTMQQANKAAANASNTQAAVNRENRRLQAALADVEEAGKQDKIKSLLAEYKKNGTLSESDAKEAELRLSRLSDVEDKRSTAFFRAVDNYLEWLKDKVSIFKSK